MKVMIHVCPSRLWYVTGYLVPSLEAQGIRPIVYNDEHLRGNLRACLASFKALTGTGDEGTWHLQDDVLICHDFADRAAENDHGVAFGFCSRYNGDDPGLSGTVYPPDLWHGFPCVRIPDQMAREFAAWVTGDDPKSPEAEMLTHINRGDDFLFREFFETVHGTETGRNVAPNLVEHVDWLLGGSIVSEWRDHIVRSDLWEDEDLVTELKAKLKTR